MKKLFILLFVFTVLVGALPLVASADTQPFCTGGKCTYVPLEPLPCISGASGSCQTGTADFGQLLASAFKLIITLGSLFAVVMLVIAGISYMLSETPMKTSAAKDRAVAALKGLLLLTGCWLVLYTINPNLLQFSIFTKNLQQHTTTIQGAPPVTNTNPTSNTGTYNSSADATVKANYTGTGSLNYDQIAQVSNTLGLKHNLADVGYVVVDPTSPNASNAVQAYKDYCEKTGVIYNASFGTMHYTAQPAPGSIVGAPAGQTLWVCTDN